MNEAQALVSRECASCGARYPEDALFCPNDGTPLQSAGGAEREADPYLGQEIAGHIEIRQLVGIGAMGRVYRAFQRGIDRDVAVKILHRELSANAQLVSRFTREAKVASRLQHPNVVQVLLAGQLPDRALYMVMEFLDGLSLQSAMLAAGGALPLERAMHIGLQLCEAVGEAHTQGIVHRDLKPENVMLVRRGSDDDCVKVLDFGIARINWGEQSVATAAGLIFGTARYISPEGAQGHAVGPPSDVYSIATLLYQMLSGRTPFEGDQAVGLLVQQIHDQPPPLASLPRAGHVPTPIADVIMANLAKDASRREPDARALGQSLVDAARAAGLSPEEISRPLLRRSSSGVPIVRGGAAAKTPAQTPTGATVKWEPPSEFQAKLAAELAGVATPRSDRGEQREPGERQRRASAVDTTLDDASAPVLPPLPSFPSVPRTVADETPSFSTQFTPPVPAAMEPPPLSEPRLPVASRPSHPSSHDAEPAPSRSRGYLFIVLCFALGVLGAAGIAWKLGKLGGDSEPDRIASRATDAMYKNHFTSPPADNVKDLTDEGLRRWPGDRRFSEIRERAASELVTQATAKRPSDAPEALRLARLAVELDAKDETAKRLVEQIEADVAAQAAKTAPPLPSGGAAPTPVKTTPSAPLSTAKVVLEVAPPLPKPTQPADLTAKVTVRGTLADPAFVVSGPGLPAPVRVAAQAAPSNVFKAAFGFPQAGKYDVAFTAVEGGKTVRASRVVVAGEAPPAPHPGPPQPGPPQPQTPPSATTAQPPPTTLPPPAPSASVKWL